MRGFLALLLLLPVSAYCGSFFSTGFGFGILNCHKKAGRLGNESYLYYRVSIDREYGIGRNSSFLLEPFLSYVSHPDRGVCFGVSGLIRYYFGSSPFFVDGGIGISYSSLKYHGQASKVLTMPQAGVGLRFRLHGREVFIENRFIHMSNAGTRHPNGAVNSDVVMFGVSF